MNIKHNANTILYGLLLSLLLPQLLHASAMETTTATQHSFLTQTIAAVTKTNTRLAFFSATCLATTAGVVWLAHHYLKPKTAPSIPPGTTSMSPASIPTNVATSPDTVAVTSAQHLASIESSLNIMNATCSTLESPFTVTQCMLLEKLYQAYGDRAVDLIWYAATKTNIDPLSQEALDGAFNKTSIQAMLDWYYNNTESTFTQALDTHTRQAKAEFRDRLKDDHEYLIELRNLPGKGLKHDDFLRLMSRIFVRDILQKTTERLNLSIRFPKEAVYFQPQLAFAGRILKINLEDTPSWLPSWLLEPASLRNQLDILSKNSGIEWDLYGDDFTLLGDPLTQNAGIEWDLHSDDFTEHVEYLVGIDTKKYFLARCPPAPPAVMTWYNAWKKQRGSHFKREPQAYFLESAEHAFKKSHPILNKESS